MKKIITNRQGFTLIELLVVIAVIGLLASIVMVNLSNARRKARDVKRISDLKQINTALERYFDDKNTYPVGIYDTRAGISGDWNVFSAFLEPNYMTDVPIDPTNGKKDGLMCSNCGEYRYNGLADNYILSTYLATDHPLKTGTNIFGPYYSITSHCKHVSFWLCN